MEPRVEPAGSAVNRLGPPEMVPRQQAKCVLPRLTSTQAASTDVPLNRLHLPAFDNTALVTRAWPQRRLHGLHACRTNQAAKQQQQPADTTWETTDGVSHNPIIVLTASSGCKCQCHTSIPAPSASNAARVAELSSPQRDSSCRAMRLPYHHGHRCSHACLPCCNAPTAYRSCTAMVLWVAHAVRQVAIPHTPPSRTLLSHQHRCMGLLDLPPGEA